MKPIVTHFLIGGVCVAVTALVVSNRLAERHAAELAKHQAAWAAEKSRLEAPLKKVKGRAVVMESSAPAAPAPAPVPDPREIIERLQAIRLGAGAVPSRVTRRLLHELENLVDAGAAALPAIREFLARNEELSFLPDGGKGSIDGRVPTDFLVPPSLRLALFDVARQIGGEPAEALLAEVLRTTGRGLEVAYLARALQEMAPNKYRELALTAAKELLANPPPGATERNDRNYLFGVLVFLHDASYVGTAQGLLVQSGGQVDRGALKYLEQTLGEQAMPVVAQAYADPRVKDAAAKEPLARVALAFVGVNAQAELLFAQAIRDPVLQPDQIRNLVEDLNKDGLINRKSPTAEDVKIIAYRYALTQQYLQQPFVQTDKVLFGAFKEADKDLKHLLLMAVIASMREP